MRVIGFRDILVIDVDNKPFEDVVATLENSPFTFWVYRTMNGFHVYVMNMTFDLQAFETWQLMYKLGCDPWYISFTKMYGSIVRIEPKPGRDERFVEEFVSQINNCGIDETIRHIVTFKDSLLV
jgi:hypothetical protein